MSTGSLDDLLDTSDLVGPKVIHHHDIAGPQFGDQHLAMQCKFGPDLQWIDTVDYRFDESVEAAFYEGIRRYYPALKDGALKPGYTGIGPRLAGPNEPLHSGAADFQIQGQEVLGVPGLVNLFGIESPRIDLVTRHCTVCWRTHTDADSLVRSDAKTSKYLTAAHRHQRNTQLIQ